MTELSDIQLTLLTILAKGGPFHGLELTAELQARYDRPIYKGFGDSQLTRRVFPNVAVLERYGYIERIDNDDRMTRYASTPSGRRKFESIVEGTTIDPTAADTVIESTETDAIIDPTAADTDTSLESTDGEDERDTDTN